MTRQYQHIDSFVFINFFNTNIGAALSGDQVALDRLYRGLARLIDRIDHMRDTGAQCTHALVVSYLCRLATDLWSRIINNTEETPTSDVVGVLCASDPISLFWAANMLPEEKMDWARSHREYWYDTELADWMFMPCLQPSFDEVRERLSINTARLHPEWYPDEPVETEQP